MESEVRLKNITLDVRNTTISCRRYGDYDWKLMYPPLVYLRGQNQVVLAVQ